MLEMKNESIYFQGVSLYWNWPERDVLEMIW